MNLAAVSSEEETGAISGYLTDGTAGTPDVTVHVYGNRAASRRTQGKVLKNYVEEWYHNKRKILAK